eukprot:4893643-Prymnesium_polylepis.1
MAASSSRPPVAGLAVQMRDEFAACLHFAKGDTPATDSVDAHIRAFLEAAKGLRQEFVRGAEEAAIADAGSREAADLTREVEQLRRELQQKEALLETHRGRVQRWSEQCAELELKGPMLLPQQFSDDGGASSSAMDTSS